MAEEQVAKRNKNRNQILRALHFEGALRRSEISRHCGIRKSSVTSLVCELLDRGIIVEDHPGNARSRLFLSSHGCYALCANVMSDQVQFARVFLNGRIEIFHHIKTPNNSAQILAVLAERFEKELEQTVIGVGVAVRGIVDPIRGVGIYAANLPDWRQVPVKSYLETKLDCVVHVANDARCQLWSNAWFGRLLKAHSNLIYLLFTEGVGSSAIIHNKIVNGANFAAGEIGHIRAGNEKRLCRCGNFDCLETYAGLDSIVGDIRRQFPEYANIRTAQQVVQAASAHPGVDRLIDSVVQRVAVALAWTWGMLAPEVLVIGSRNREFSELLRAKITAHLRLMGCDKVQDSRILAAESEEESMLRGMAGFIFEHGFKNDILTVDAGKKYKRDFIEARN